MICIFLCGAQFTPFASHVRSRKASGSLRQEHNSASHIDGLRVPRSKVSVHWHCPFFALYLMSLLFRYHRFQNSGLSMSAEINPNDFRPFWNSIIDFESIFVVAGLNKFDRFDFFCVSGFLCSVLWLVFTRGQTHITETAQHRFTQHNQTIVFF